MQTKETSRGVRKAQAAGSENLDALVDTNRPKFSLEEKTTLYEGDLPARADKFATTATVSFLLL